LDELIDFAKEQGSPAVAISDHGTMYGVIEFYEKCKKAGIKPIIGVETYLAPGSRHDKVSRDDERRSYHLLLLAKNNIGYKNLIKLVSIAHLEGFYYKPRIDWEVLQKHHNGLIACTACLGGEIPVLIRSNKLDQARTRILEYNNLFGQNNFYLEIQHHPNLRGQDLVNEKLIEFSRELNVPLVATNDSHYLKKEDADSQDILLCLQNKKKVDDKDRMNMMESDFSVRPTAEMIESFMDVPEAIENSIKIADMCDVEIELGNVQLPYFEVPSGFTESSYFRKLCEDGMVKRFGKTYEQIDVQYKERMDYELSVIDKMGWPSYFLIVADFVNWAKNRKIVVGPGRGSAAGSLVCYLTGITNLDPIEYDLLFERFLNPDRVSMPDIDLDFADIRRDEVISYVEEKYGKDHVAQIITFGTMAARAAVKDVGRALGVPYEYCDKLSKAIPMFTSIQEALDTVDEFSSMYKKEPEAKRVIDHALRLEGVARHSSTHACGVLITKDQLTENVPVQFASSGDKTIVSQYSLHPVEDLGLLKMDFLGLKNLTIIESAIKIIKKTRGIEIDINKIPLDNKETYELFQKGETTGVFQFESSGMKRYLRELKSTEFEDIIAMVALYRPGPMEWIPDYIGGKNGTKKLTYLHPKLEPILKKTYGVAIYQEQVMQISRDLAGFTKGEADVLRKAMGKKIVSLLAKQKKKFIDGCVNNNISKDLAEKIFSFIEPFAGYGFNRSHAACYALIGYQTAYLKAHWPTEFMAALLTADQQNIDRIAIEIEECRRMGIEVMPPDVNQSFETFTVVTSGTEKNQTAKKDEDTKTIRFGLHAVKNIGENISKVLIEERKSGGPYKDLNDLLERITDKDLNKKSLESLIKSGGFDSFGERGHMLGNVENMISYNKEVVRSISSKQESLFADVPELNIRNMVKMDYYDPANRQVKLTWEKELLGLYITEHPFSDFRKYTEDHTISLHRLHKYIEHQVNIAGIITTVKKIITRTNKAMLFVKIEDEYNNTEILVFPRLLDRDSEVWKEGKFVIINGKISNKDNEIKVLANTVEELILEKAERIVARFKNQNSQSITSKNVTNPLRIIFNQEANQEILERLKGVFIQYPGGDMVLFRITVDGKSRIIKTAYQVNNDMELIKKLTEDFRGVITIKEE